MRYVIGALIGLVSSTIPAGAQENGTNGSRETEPPSVEEAQELRSPRDIQSIEDNLNILEEIQIELLDLEELEREVSRRLAGETIRLSLDECIQIALEQNQDILVVSYEPEKADADILSARGDFDLQLSGSASYTRSEQSADPTTAAFGGFTAIENATTNSQLSLGGLTHWGTQYDVSMNFGRENGTFTAFMEQFSGGLTVSLTQPLLRGLGRDANFFRVRTALNNKSISRKQVELTLLNTVGEVIKAYWDLVGAIENLTVRQESLENAQRLVDITERQLEIGTVAALDVLQAKAGVATRQSDLISARTSIADAEDNLKNLLSMRDGDLFSPDRIVPTDRPSVGDYDWDVRQSMELALEYRPEIRQSELEIRNAEVEMKRARNDTLPQLDINGSFTSGGRDQEISDTFTGIRDSQDESYTIGIQGSIPIPNRAARGSLTRAKLDVRQAEQRLEQTKNDVMLAVSLAVRGVVSSRALFESNQQATNLQRASVAAEEKRLKLGTTTSQNVLEIQEDLTNAQTQEVQAAVNFEKAIIDLRVAEGTLLDNLGIEYEPEVEGADPGFWRSIVPFVEK